MGGQADKYNLLHSTYLHFLQRITNVEPFSKCALWCSGKPDDKPYLEPAEFNLRVNYFFKMNFNITVCFAKVFPLEISLSLSAG